MKTKIEILACITTSLILLLSEVDTYGQQQTLEPKYKVDSESGGACEANNAAIDQLVKEAKKSKERIFIISRLSKVESYKLNQVRLANASFFLTEGKEIPSSQIITAIGGRTDEKTGLLEFYLGSQLFLVSEAKKNKAVCLTCCDSPL